MKFLLSTVGSDVIIKDLGITITHPTVNRDIALEFSIEEIYNSYDLTSAISVDQSIVLRLETQDFGIYEVDPTEYNNFSILEENIDFTKIDNLITEDELLAGFANRLIKNNIFPISISSITAGTNAVSSTTAMFKDWRVSSKDIIYFTDNGPNDGYKTVNEILDQKILSTVEPLTTTGSIGAIYLFNPPGASKIGIDITNLNNISASTLQEAIEQIDTVSVFDLNRAILEINGSMTYIGNGDILVASTPIPNSIV